jgi:subtilisin family serine protease
LEAGPVEKLPSATPGELAEAVVDCVDRGAWVLNLSAALAGGSIGGEYDLGEALGYAARRGVLVVAAAGNQGAVGGSAITRHPWVIPVAGYARVGWPLAESNLGRLVGSGGLGALGEGVVSLTPEGKSIASGGTSAAAPFVTGAAALLWSAFPGAAAAEIKHALLSSASGRRKTVAPPLLNAWGAYEVLSDGQGRRAMP